jgi:hypothetical protein
MLRQKIYSAALISLIFHPNQNNKYNEKNPPTSCPVLIHFE